MPEFEIRSKGGRRLEWPQVELARGQYPHFTETHKFGGSTSLTTVFTPIANGSVYQTPTSATPLEILSASSSDSTSGTGAWKVTVTGLSSDWTEISEEVTLSGTSPVALVNSFTRVYRAFVSESGTYATASAGSHGGNITIRSTGGAATWARINAEDFARGQTEIGCYTVPKGKTAYLFVHNITVDSNKSADMVFFQRTNCDTTSAPYTAMRMVNEYVGITGVASPGDTGAPQGPFVGPCDIGFMGKAAATSTVEVEYEILLVDNEDA